jgi:hypothetical protein
VGRIPKRILQVAIALLLFDATVALYAYNQVGYNTYKERYLSWFGLSAASTVHDFRKSSWEFQEHWLEHMCRSGVCLHPVDWACGFTINRDDDEEYRSQKAKIESCFIALIKTAPLSDQLGKLRLLCGRRHMIFAGEWRTKPADCEAAGGQWGKKAPLFADEDSYFKHE